MSQRFEYQRSTPVDDPRCLSCKMKRCFQCEHRGYDNPEQPKKKNTEYTKTTVQLNQRAPTPPPPKKTPEKKSGCCC